METENYANSAEIERSRGNNQSESNPVQSGGASRIFMVVGICFGLMFILQAVLNVSLRLHTNGRPQSSDNISASLITELKMEKDQLIEEKDQLKMEKDQLIEEKDQLRTEKDQLIEEKDQLNQEAVQLNQEIDLLFTKVSQLTQQMAAMQAANKHQSDDLSGLRETLRQKQKEIEDLRERGVQRCPPGWDQHDLHCYGRFQKLQTWDEATRSCQLTGAHLLSINDEAEQVFVSTLVSYSVWLDFRGRYDPLTSKWTVADGRCLCYTNWAETPVYVWDYGKTLCASIRQTSGSWYGNLCEHKLPYICEKKMSFSTVIPK